MKRRVTFRSSAEADLDAIFEHIARDSPRSAIVFTRRVREQCARLSDFPERGTRRDDLGPGIRLLGFKRRVTILFRILTDRVQIVHIPYGGRDLKRLAADERLD